MGYSASLPNFTRRISSTSPSPNARPSTVPMTSWMTMVWMIGSVSTGFTKPTNVSVLSTTLISVVVNTYAIGSFAPDSNSSSGRKLCFNPIPFVRSTENTLALSVLDIVAAISNASQIETDATALSQPKRR